MHIAGIPKTAYGLTTHAALDGSMRQTAPAQARTCYRRTEPLPARRRRTRRGVDVGSALSPQDAVRFLRENKVVLVYDQTTRTLQAGTSGVAKTIVGKAG